MNNLYFQNNYDDGFDLHHLEECIGSSSNDYISNNVAPSTSLLVLNIPNLHSPTNNGQTSQHEANSPGNFSPESECIYSIYCRE